MEHDCQLNKNNYTVLASESMKSDDMSARVHSYVVSKGLRRVPGYLATQKPQAPEVKIFKFWRCLFSDSASS
jgi:hypothetical protein